jgi:hypothetical protein
MIVDGRIVLYTDVSETWPRSRELVQLVTGRIQCGAFIKLVMNLRVP